MYTSRKYHKEPDLVMKKNMFMIDIGRIQCANVICVLFCNSLSNIGIFTQVCWRGVFTVVYPLMFLPVFFINGSSPEYRCLYLIILMAGFWVSEAIPIAVTSTFPIAYCPLTGLLNTDEACKIYFHPTIGTFAGSLMIALAIENCRLHKRLALTLVHFIGCSHRKLHLGVMFTCMFMSAWIPNTATTALMCPIIMAILRELEKQNMSTIFKPAPEGTPYEDLKPTGVTLAYFLAASYSSLIGGASTLVGAPTNLAYRALYEMHFPNSPEGLDFAKFFAFSAPTMIIINIAAWVVLQIQYLGLFRPASNRYKIIQRSVEATEISKQNLDAKYADMKKLSWHQFWVLFLFLLTIMLWILRDPGQLDGWSSLFKLNVDDASMVFIIIVIMFLFPAEPRFLRIFSNDPTKRPKRRSDALLMWKTVHQRFPWGLLFLFGGGFALAKASEKSGMSMMFTKLLQSWLKPFSATSTMIIMSCITVTTTCFVSNVAVVNVVAPILFDLAILLKVHPIYLSLPPVIMCSFSFSIPVSTPPNAIVQAYSHIPTFTMVKTGLVVTIIAVVIFLFMYETWGTVIYDAKYPDWATKLHQRSQTTYPMR